MEETKATNISLCPNLTLDILSANGQYYFYILECSDGSKYYGHTNNLKKRLIRHSKGQVFSTKGRRPVSLVYYEEAASRSEAFKKEQRFKNGRTRKVTIDKILKVFSLAKCQGFNSTI